jgi:hypothetical protein
LSKPCGELFLNKSSKNDIIALIKNLLRAIGIANEPDVVIDLTSIQYTLSCSFEKWTLYSSASIVGHHITETDIDVERRCES